MKMYDRTSGVLIGKDKISARIKQLAAEISRDYEGKDLLLVGVLKGGWMYMADLVRELTIDCDVDFMMVSSYGSGTESSGEVKVLKDLSCDCRGRNVLIVEDIIDSGVTLSKLRDAIAARQAQSVEITALLSKPSRRKTQVEVKYVGFEIPDKFVVGYGMDFAEKLRGLPEVCVLKEKEYKK